MAGSSFGTIFRITTWGESHGTALGVTIDGCPAGLPLSEADIQPYLDKRKPGRTIFATPRKENDTAHILSGVFNGKTTGTPVCIIIENTSQRSGDYDRLATCYRPGHADFTYDAKYGFRDYRGGGRSSGRETVARVAAGAVAVKILKTLGISVTAYTSSIGPVQIDRQEMDWQAIWKTPTCMPDKKASADAEAYLKSCISNQDSSGGTVECLVTGVPAGLGEPVFDKLDAVLSQALFSIGAVKAVEIGDGSLVSHSKGSENNDSYTVEGNRISKVSNHAGGILGGISDGDSILARVHFKPTPSISREQDTVDKSGNNIKLQIQGRHDPVIVPRAVVVVESMTALTIVDALLLNLSSKMENLIEFYGK